MDRLDEVCGPENWSSSYNVYPDAKFVECTITIAGTSKSDAAEFTAIEAIKGGYSDSLKRAAVHWGIGRYLYRLTETWARCSSDKQDGWNYAKSKDGKAFYWAPPELPAWALPGGKVPAAVVESQMREPGEEDEAHAGPALAPMASQPQIKLIRALSKELGYTGDVMKDMFKRKFGEHIDSHNLLTMKMAGQVIDGLQEKSQKGQKAAIRNTTIQAATMKEDTAQMRAWDGSKTAENEPSQDRQEEFESR